MNNTPQKFFYNFLKCLRLAAITALLIAFSGVSLALPNSPQEIAENSSHTNLKHKHNCIPAEAKTGPCEFCIENNCTYKYCGACPGGYNVICSQNGAGIYCRRISGACPSTNYMCG